MRVKNPKSLLLGSLAIIALLAGGYIDSTNPELSTQLTRIIQQLESLLGGGSVAELDGPARVVRVSDGDTIVVMLDNREEKVRLIGIDTPEKYESDKLTRTAREFGLSERAVQALGQQSSDYANGLLQNQRVYLEYDTERTDPYDRVLAYVYVKRSDGAFMFGNERFEQINLRMVQAGWAEDLTITPNTRYASRYQQATDVAYQQQLGMWQVIR